MKKTEIQTTKVYISFSLDDEEAQIFNNYKKLQFLKNNAEAARKLMFERLQQLTSDRTKSDTRGARELAA